MATYKYELLRIIIRGPGCSKDLQYGVKTIIYIYKPLGIQLPNNEPPSPPQSLNGLIVLIMNIKDNNDLQR